MRAVRVLDALTHPAFHTTLANMGHDFVLAPSEIYVEWPVDLRLLPANCTVVHDLPDPSNFDVAIVATREHYGRLPGRIDPARIAFVSRTQPAPLGCALLRPAFRRAREVCAPFPTRRVLAEWNAV